MEPVRAGHMCERGMGRRSVYEQGMHGLACISGRCGRVGHARAGHVRADGVYGRCADAGGT